MTEAHYIAHRLMEKRPRRWKQKGKHRLTADILKVHGWEHGPEFGPVMKDVGALKPEEVNALGFVLSDKKAGPFKMEVEWIKVERARK